MADPTPILLPVETDPAALKQSAEDVLTGYMPDWQPDRAGLTSHVLEGDAQVAAQISTTAQDVATDIYIDSGQRLDGIMPFVAIAATITATWTAQDTNGYLLPAGSVAGIDVGGGQLVRFQTVADYLLVAGSASLAGVSMTAAEAGTGANSLTGAGVIVDAPSEWTAVAFTDTSGGGQDAEDADTYVARLSVARRLRAPRPITADDYPDFLRESVEGVARAAVLNGYNPTTNNYTSGYVATNSATWQKLKVTLSAVDANGAAITGSVKTMADAVFNGNPSLGVKGVREVNWVVAIADPHFTDVGVHTTVAKWEGFAATDVQAAVVDALQTFLSPTVFGSLSGNTQSAQIWNPLLAVTLDDLRVAIRSVESVKGISALTVGASGGSLAAADYTLPTTNAEPIPMPRPGTDIVVTVT